MHHDDRRYVVVDSNQSGHFRNVYSCGLVTQWIAAARTATRGNSSGKRSTVPVPYTTADYLSSLRAITSSPEGIEQLVSGHAGRADLFLAEQLRTSGIAVKLVNADQATATPAVFEKHCVPS